MLINGLKAHGGSEQLIKILSSVGLRELYPPQSLTIKAGLLEKEDSFVISAPTASGKTLIAEMAILKSFLERRGKALYLVPLRALAREKYEDLSGKYREIGMRIIQSTGDYDSAEPWLHDADVIVSTNEKMDSLIRHHASWLREVSLVVADEIHLLGDPHRGPTLEIVITRLRRMRPNMRFIALSATIPNAEEISSWLRARLICSDWRPVPLREGVYFNGAGIFNDGTVTWISEESGMDAVDLAIDTVKENGQALIFVDTRRATETVARKASAYIARMLPAGEREVLKQLSGEVIGVSAEPTRLCRRLAECVSKGVAFHHAGIASAQRRLIEDAFRANRLKLIASTTTLAMGLNLPSRRVIIRNWWRYESGVGLHPIPIIEIKQMSGRAGRPGFDTYGEAIIVARNKKDEEYLFENYISGRPERIISRLSSESALRTHILASIAGAFTRDRDSLIEFLRGTFFAHQSGAEQLSFITDMIIDFLEAEGMITSKNGRLMATKFGRRVSELYIDPVTGVVIRDALHHTGEKEEFALLHMIARTPDMMRLSVRKRDYDEMLELFYAHADNLLIPDNEKYPSEEALSEIKTASALMEWISETPEDKLAGHFGVGPGDIHTLVELSEWLLYSAGEISRIFGLRDAVKNLSLLRVRVEYGVKEELLELVSLRGIGRVRARNLYNAGYRGIKDIKRTAIRDLASVPSMGETIARDIKRQIDEK